MAVFTSVAIQVVDAVQLGVAFSTLYTCPATAGGYSEIVELIIANDTTTDIAVTLCIVPSGGTAGVTNLITGDAAMTLKSGDSFSVTELLGHLFLEPSGTLQGKASAATQATTHVAGFDYAP